MPRKISEQVALTGSVEDYSTNTVYLAGAQDSAPVAAAVDGHLAEFILSLLVTAPIAPTFQDWRDGTIDKFSTYAFELELGEPAEVLYNSGDPVIDYGDGGTPETIDDGKTRTLKPFVNVDSGGDCDLIIMGVSGQLVGDFLPIVFYNDGGVTAAPDIVTTNAEDTGITITAASGVVNPGLGTADGDWLMAIVWLKSATEGVIMNWLHNE